MKSAKMPEDLEKLKSERDNLSGEIKTIRRELWLSHDILKQLADIKRKVSVEMKLRAERYNNEIMKTDKQTIKSKGLVR
jgi:hypothetical protein